MSLTTIEAERATKRLNALGWAVANHPDYTLQKTIRRFQAAHLEPTGKRLLVDGEIGPKTAAALYENYTLPDVFSVSGRAVDIAISQIGITELPLGSNKGPQVSIYHRTVGVGEGNPWCMSFIYWCFSQAARQLGVKNPMPKSAHCKTVWNLAVQKELPTLQADMAREHPELVVPGMVPIWIIAPLTGAGHTGIIPATAGRQWTTVEGNTNELTMSREGVMVARLSKRHVTDKILLGLIGPF